jgi:hypothetical protein
VEDLFGQFHSPSIFALPPVSTTPPATRSSKPLRRSSSLEQVQQLLVARLDHLGQGLARELARRPLADARHLDVLVDALGRQGAGVADLDVLGVLGRRAQGHGDVVGDLIAGDGDDGVADGAIGEHGEVGGAAADVDQADAELLLVLAEHRVAGTELAEHQVVHLQTAAADALDDVLRGADRAGDHVHPRLQAHAAHADGLADALLVVDDEFLRQDVQDLLVRRDRHRAGGVDDPVDVRLHHLVLLDGGDAVGVQAADMAAGDAGMHRVDLAAGHQLGLLDRALDGLHRGLDIHDDALLQAVRRMRADADDLDGVVGLDLADQRGDLRGADVEPDHQVLFTTSGHAVSSVPEV